VPTWFNDSERRTVLRLGKYPSTYLLEPMSRTALLIAILTMSGCDGKSIPHEAILGKWKSNAHLTLESVFVADGITPQTRAFLERDFFGHLVVEIRENDSRTTNERDNYDSGYEPYEVLEIGDDYIRINAWSNFFQAYDERTLYFDRDCYYEIFASFKFRQYFCRYG